MMLECDASAARSRFPTAENKKLRAVEAGNGFDGRSKSRGSRVRVRESADGAVDGNELEGNLLRDGHHHLLQLGLGAESDQPELAAGMLGGKSGGFVKRARGPRIEHRGQHHFVFQSRAVRPCCWLQSLQRIGNDPARHDCNDHLILGVDSRQLAPGYDSFQFSPLCSPPAPA